MSYFRDIYFDTLITKTFINKEGLHCSSVHKYITTHLIYIDF